MRQKFPRGIGDNRLNFEFFKVDGIKTLPFQTYVFIPLFSGKNHLKQGG